MKMMSTILKLAYSPLSAREISKACNDECILSALEQAHIYMIAKKPQIYFSDIRTENNQLKLKIKNVIGSMDVSIPLNQPIFETDLNKELILDIGSNDRYIKKKNGVVCNAHGLNFYQIDKDILKNISEEALDLYMVPENFIFWLTPEKLLFLYRNKDVRIPNFDKTKEFFGDYEVLYIGKATEERVLERLDGHKTFLKILQSEIESYKQIRDDVVVLFFEVDESRHSILMDEKTTEQDIADAIMIRNLPSVETLCLEAEKIYINKFTPKYNEIVFKQYPKSDDGLFRYNYDIILYTLHDSINLLFKNMVFSGGYKENHLLYVKNEGVSVQTHESLKSVLSNKIIERL